MKTFGFGVSGLVVGSLLSWLLLEPGQASFARSNASELAQMRAEALQFDQKLEQIRVLLSQRGAAASILPDELPPRLAANRDEIAELSVRLLAVEQSLSQLTETIQALADRSSAPLTPELVLTKTDHPMETTLLATLLYREETDLDLEHLGWSYQKVLDRYGKPTRNGPSPSGGGQKWYYFLESGESLIFWFQDGKISRVLLN